MSEMKPTVSPAKIRRRMRIKLMMAGAMLLSIAVALMLFAFQDSIVFFYGPSDIAQGKVQVHKNFRLGGLVKEGTVTRDNPEDAKSGKVHFVVTDGVNQVMVAYEGILPDLFREGQGVVALGKLSEDGNFIATEVLAKHDEKYMPQEAIEAMKRAGTWKGGE